MISKNQNIKTQILTESHKVAYQYICVTLWSKSQDKNWDLWFRLKSLTKLTLVFFLLCYTRQNFENTSLGRVGLHKEDKIPRGKVEFYPTATCKILIMSHIHFDLGFLHSKTWLINQISSSSKLKMWFDHFKVRISLSFF